MARYGDLDSQYFDDAGDPLVNGKIYFYETGTTTPKTTYADINYTIPNTNPVILTAAGRQPNIFFPGVAKAVLTTSAGVQILVRDPVGETASTFGNPWIASKQYNANDVVIGTDGEFYVSLVSGNTNNDPVTTTGYWTFLYSVEWNSGITYKVGSVVTYDTIVYQSLQNANLNQNPSTATSYWVPIQLVWSATSTYAINANVVGTDGVLYTSLQNANTNHTPASSPSWWVGTSAAAAASASAAATSATSASTSATNAATSATSASSSASSASTSATNAAASATTASTQASNASTSASSAATSATNALSYLNTFKGQYYGPLASDPTVDPLGAAMTAGDLYWNTTASQMRTYTGSAWIAAYIPVTGYALSGANSDITSLSGLTTPLSVGQGGTGASTLTSNNVILGNGTSAVQFVAPGTNGNVLTSNGTTWTSAVAPVITNIVTATSSTTLTSTKTLLQITPTSYGVTVTLPNATTMTAGGPAHVIDNRSAYSVRVVNNSNTLLGFVPAKSTVPVFLDSAATSAGVWSFTGLSRLGISAQLATTVLTAWGARGIIAVDMDGDIEIVYGYRSSDGYFTAVAYKNSTNTFGTPVVIRSASVQTQNIALKHSATQLLAVSCTDVSTALEAVIVTLNASTLALTVNTAATATLAGNITAFTTGCALVALPSLANSFVINYSRSTATIQAIRAISVSGTTVTIGAETTLDGTDGNSAIVATADKVIAASATQSNNLYTKPYTISGSTITAGTGTNTVGVATVVVRRLFALGSRWCVLYNSNSQVNGGIISLSGTTTSISTAVVTTDPSIQDAIVINSSKVLVGCSGGSNYYNILTDSSGTASVGTAITGGAAFRGLFVVSDIAYTAQAAASSPSYRAIDCSGSSPVLVKTFSRNFDAVFQPSATDTALNKSPTSFFTSNYAFPIGQLNATTPFLAEITEGGVNAVQPPFTILSSFGRGRNDAERWAVSNSDLLSKMECAQ